MGLDNLGNLCYANSALQCLFMNRRLRAGLFAADSEAAQSGVLLEIRYIRQAMSRLASTCGLGSWPTEVAAGISTSPAVYAFPASSNDTVDGSPFV